MNPLEKSNLNTQISLMEDIIQNDTYIFYGVATESKKIYEIVSGKQYDEKGAIVLSKEEREEIIKLSRLLSRQEDFGQLGVLAGPAFNENRIKKEILKQLQSKD